MLLLPTDQLDLCILLYREGVDRQVSGRNVTVRLPGGLVFNEVVDALEASGRYVADDEIKQQVEFSLPGCFFFSLGDLMVKAERRLNPPTRFYLSTENYLHGKDEATIEIRRLVDAGAVFGLLKQVADHYIDHAGRTELVFLGKQKLIVNSEFGPSDLASLDGLTEFRQEFFSDQTHADQKCGVLKSILSEMFGQRGCVRFADVLASFHDLVNRARRSYALYVSEFSFEKIRAEVEKQRLEFTTRLNKVFSDIQNQLLAVPVALILVGGQMQNAGSLRISNLTIWIGALVFSVLMALLIRNQGNTLQAVRHEFELQWQTMVGDEKLTLCSEQFESAYTELNKRYHHQKWLLSIVDALVAASFALTSGLLVWYSGWIK